MVSLNLMQDNKTPAEWPMNGKKQKRFRFEVILKRLGVILSLASKLKHLVDSFF